MMNLKLFLSFVFLIAAGGYGSLYSQNDNYWSLEECIEHAWQHNLRLQQQKLSVSLANQTLLQSRANVFPDLNAGAAHSYSIGRMIDPIINEFVTETVQSNNFNIAAGVSIFNGFQLRNLIRQNSYELDAQKHDLEKSFNDVALTVASAYLQILFSKELLESAGHQLDITRQQVARTAKLVEAGTLAMGSLLTIQAQQATEELRVVNAQNQLDLAVLELRQLMYLPPDVDFSIEVPDVAIAPEETMEYTPLAVFNTALEIQPEIKSAESRILGAERGLAAAKGSRSPSLSLRGTIGTGYSDARLETIGDPIVVTDPITGLPTVEFETRTKPFSDQIRDNLNQNIGLYLSIPIFNNFQSRVNISRSRINLENAQLQDRIIRDQLFKTIQQSHADAQAALKRYHASEKNVDALQEAFRYTEQRFGVGMVNSLEYNDAKNRLTIAKSERLQAKYEFIFRSKILDFYMGNPLKF